ncbi:MAG: hypothetical protein KTR30_35835 [Saprospiraceae bacterium]|nr:hypothetical protein [Saprospiraceae bacterium]
MTKKSYFLQLLALLCLLSTIAFGCKKESSPAIGERFQSALILDFANESFSFQQAASSRFSGTEGSKSNFFDAPEFTRVSMIKGLGEESPNDETLRNALFINIVRKFDNVILRLDQVQAWLGTGAQAFMRDKRAEDGVGILWIDETGTIWSTGKHIAEFRENMSTFLPDEVLPSGDNYQQGSRFSITHSTPLSPKPGFDFSQEVRMEFNATLYNAAGDSLVIRNGIFETVFDFILQ